MNRKYTFKFWLSTLVLLVFAISAGGSFDGENIGLVIAVIVAVVLCIAIWAWYENEKDVKRKNLKSSLEERTTDFDMSDAIGDERCSLYYDKSKRQILIALIDTDGIEKKIVDNIEKTAFTSQGDGRFAIADKQKKLLAVYHDSSLIKREVIDYSSENWDANSSKEYISPTLCGDGNDFLLIDEQFGTIVFCTYKDSQIKYSIFHYPVNKNDIRIKSSIIISKYIKPHINISSPEEYIMLVQDEKDEEMIILSWTKSRTPILDIIRYEDIIDVSYIENGNTVSSRSTTRTIGGALIGGALVGGAGAVVGGLSGNSTEYKSVSSVVIKILLRSSNNNSIIIDCYHGKPLSTKDKSMKKLYDQAYKNAQQIKDIFSVIIDKVDKKQLPPQVVYQQTASPNTLNVSDELMKLAKLKEQGILTEEEFAAQKAKILNL